MKFLFTSLLLLLLTTAQAQETETIDVQTSSSLFTANTKIISFGIAFPNLYRIRYGEPAGYQHLRTRGFGPMYAKLEWAAFKNTGLVASFGYGTFHYAYYGYSQQVVHYDDVNTISLSFSGNYHFGEWVKMSRLDVYAGAGLSVDYLKYIYGNIPPYRSPEYKAQIHPVVRAGARYYLDRTFGFYAEAGYDGLSLIQLGFSVKF